VDQFTTKLAGDASVLAGWDRLVFRGTYRILHVASGMMQYLWCASVLLKDFGQHAEEMTRTLLEASLAAARQCDRPIIYLPSSATSKEEKAQEVLRHDPVDTGLVCVLKSVEPCVSYSVHRDRDRQKLSLRVTRRKCSYLYHYLLDPCFGLVSARIQTWFPFAVQICVNGREWLARRMDRAGLAYERHDNSFPWIADFPRAQRLMDGVLRQNWPRFLNGIAGQLNPAAQKMFESFPVSYYWSAHQSEWATDIAFDHPRELSSLYPQMAWGAITSFSSPDVMRFLGRRFSSRFNGEVVSDFRDRAEGIRVKHSVNGNSVKMYDKGPNILRIETTINHPRDLKVYRKPENKPEAPKKWLPMRKGVADLHRRAEVSQKTNERYLDALSSLDTDVCLRELFVSVSRPVCKRGNRYRALRLWTEDDQRLLEAINRPEYLAAGFRNRDLAEVLYPTAISSGGRKRAAGRISYRLRLLRAHGLVAKLARTRRYRITRKGQQIATAAAVSQRVTMQQLTRAAA
jgi:hypothetical protein